MIQVIATSDTEYRKPGAWFYIALAYLPLLYLPGFGVAYREVKFVAFWLIGAACVWALVRDSRTKPLDFRSGHLVGVVFIGWILIMIPGSTNPGLSIQYTSTSLATFAVAAYTSNRQIDCFRLSICILFSGCIAALQILLTAWLGISLLPDSNSMGGLIGERNSASLTIALGLFSTAFLVDDSIERRRWITTGILCSLCSLLVSSIVFTRTRSVWWLLAFWLLGTTVISLRRLKSVQAWKTPVALCGAVVFAGVLVATVPGTLRWNSPEPYFDSLLTMTSLTQSSGRDSLWTVGLTMFLNAPITGVGPGNFASLFRTYVPISGASPLVFAFLRPDLPIFNDYLQAFIELGILGGALFVCLAVVIPCWFLARAFRIGLVSAPAFFAISSLTCVALTINGFFDYPFNRPETLFVFGCLVGCLATHYSSAMLRPKLRFRYLAAPFGFSILILTLSATALFVSLAARCGYFGSVTSSKIEIARNLWPWDRFWDDRTAILAVRVGRADIAQRIALEGMRFWPNHPTPYLSQAEIMRLAGKSDEAFHAYEKALFQVPNGRCFRPAYYRFRTFIEEPVLSEQQRILGTSLLETCRVRKLP